MKELHSATNNFNYDNKLGEGGFGSVYWGQLWDGSQVINALNLSQFTNSRNYLLNNDLRRPKFLYSILS